MILWKNIILLAYNYHWIRQIILYVAVYWQPWQMRSSQKLQIESDEDRYENKNETRTVLLCIAEFSISTEGEFCWRIRLVWTKHFTSFI